MGYQQPDITRDAMSEIHYTEECEEQGETHDDDNDDGIILPTGIGINLTRIGDHDGDIDNTVTSPGFNKFESNAMTSEMGRTLSTFTAQTSTTLHFDLDLDSNIEFDELLPQMINKVCTSKKTKLIDHNELIIDKLIGKGHYGEVYIGKYDGNQVAIKIFPDLDVHIVENNNKSRNNIEARNELKEESVDSPLIGDHVRSLEKTKSLQKGSYNAINMDDDNDDDDDDDDKFDIDDNGNNDIKKKIYERKKQIYSEVVLASSLPLHPNLVQILGITQNPLKIVMSYYEGDNLENFIYREKRKLKYNDKITLNSILILMQKIADGILFLHNNKMIHRNIAARNVLLGYIENNGQINENTKVVVSDFGMTRCMINDESITNSNIGQITKHKIGPIKWMAPESISKQKHSHKSDVYMFGITMFEIMNGKQPYTSSKYINYSLPILATKIIKESIRPIIDETDELKTILVGNDQKMVIPQINKLIKNCWKQLPRDRPTILSILHTLNSIYDSMLGLTY